MATAAELLAATTPGDNTLIIDNYLRTIEIPSTITCLGVENDDDVLRLNFRMPRRIGDIDLSIFTVRINYLNAKGEDDVYLVEDLTTDDDHLTFSWLVGPTATRYKGNTKFNVCMRIVDGDGYIQKEYNTTIATLPVLEGLECEESVVENYTDIIEQWRRQIFGAGDSVMTDLLNQSQNEIETIRNEGARLISTGRTIKEELLVQSEEERQKIVDKGNEVLATIPEDYITAYNQVDNAYRSRANAIVSAAQGETVMLTDASDDSLRGLRIFGKTTQVTTTGAQLLDLPYVERKEDRGLVQTISNGVCTVSGSTTSTSAFNLTLAGVYSSTVPIFTLPAGTYTATDCDIYTYDGTNRVKYSGTFTIDSEINVNWVATRSYNYHETVDETTYPMLNRGGTALPWEPYTGQTATPNPDYPQEMTDLSSPTISVYGKNLLAPKNNYSGGYRATVNPDGSVTVTGAATTTNPIYLTLSRCSESEPLRLSKDKKYYAWGESSNGIYIGTKTLDSNGTPAWATISTWNKHVGTEFTNLVQVYLESNDHAVGDTRLCGTYRFQLEVGDKFTGFEAYKEVQTATLLSGSIHGIPVSESGNYIDANGQQWISDELDFERGVRVNRINARSLRGIDFVQSDNSTWSKDILRFDAADIYQSATRTPLMCDRFVNRFAHDPSDIDVARSHECISTHSVNDVVSVFINKNRLETPDLAGFTKWLEENRTTVAAIRHRPVETGLPSEEIAKFRAFHTNRLNTTILNDVGVMMEVKYNKDTKTYVDSTSAKELAESFGKFEPLILDANLSDYYGGHTEFGDEALEAIKTGRHILVRVPNASGDNYVASYSPVYMYQLPCNGQYLYLFFLRDEKQDLSSLLGQPAGTIQMPTYGEFQMLLSRKYDSNPLET